MIRLSFKCLGNRNRGKRIRYRNCRKKLKRLEGKVYRINRIWRKNFLRSIIRVFIFYFNKKKIYKNVNIFYKFVYIFKRGRRIGG